MAIETRDFDAIFCAAIEIAAPGDRTAFLADACGPDADLRRRVENLVSAHFRAGRFLESPTASPIPTTDQPGFAAGALIGPYKLLQQIGEGGMGTVFMAEQSHPVQRKVALKLIKPGMDSRQVLARFEAERQALAMMDHVNIARVLDAGMTGSEPGGVSPGRPYFVMELVHGIPITKYCDDNHLTPRERLELFVPVCLAIQHAHQKGIIHRDIKPSNVMVTLYDGKPVPKVIDFGVAKATEQRLTERTLFTQYGTMIGTFEYMSPEQAEMSALGADTRSDIFSLGVLLYELLTGSTPLGHKRLKEAAFAEVLRMIKEEEPPKPSTRLSESGAALASISAQRHMEPARLTKLMRGELDWIVMKTLEKDRNRRYETAGAFAADMQRYLNDEQVLACPPSALYRFRKFARRNKAALVTASLVVSALVAGTAVATWQAVRATRARAVADQQAAIATSITDYLQQMFSSIEPASGKGLDYTVRQLLDEYAGDLEKHLPDQPEVEATLQGIIGRAFACLGQRDKGRKHLERALVLRRSVFGDQHEKYADSLVDRARPDVSDLSEFPEREANLRQALAIYRANGIGGKPVIYALWTLQWILVQHAWDGAVDKWEEIEPVWKEAAAEAAKTPGVEFPELAYIQSGLVQAMLVQSRYVEAEATARQTLAMRMRLNGPEHLQTAWGYYVLGGALRAQHKFAEAIQVEKRALAIMRKKLPPEHGNIAGALTLMIDTLAVAANSHALTDQFPSVAALGELESVYREVLTTTKPTRLNDEDPVVVAVWGLIRLSEFYVELSRELAAAGRPKEAEESRQKATLLLEGLQRQYAENPDLLPFVYSYGTIALTNAGQPLQAKELCRKLLDQATPKGGAAHNKLAWFLANAEVPAHRDPILAIELAKRAVESDPKSSNYLNTLGVARYRAGDWKRAISDLERSHAIGSANPFDFYFLAMANWKLGEKEMARVWFERAVPKIGKYQPQNTDLRRAHAEAAELLGVNEKKD